MNLKIKINNISHEGNFNINTEQVPKHLFVKSLDDIKYEVSHYVETDTPDYVELVITDVDYDIIESSFGEFILEVKAQLNYNTTTESEGYTYLGVKRYEENVIKEFISADIISYKVKSNNVVDKPQYKRPARHVELVINDLLEENEFLYDEENITMEIAVKGFYLNGSLYAYEGEKLW